MIRDNRLNSIASLIDKNTNILLDIGTDHGFLIKKAFDQQLIKKAIASDINEQPLNNAINNLEGYNVDFVISNGFENIKEPFDCVVIAGMGANLIVDILKDAPENKSIQYILQPNNKTNRLRLYLSENQYKIIDEIIVEENEYFYVIIKAIKEIETLTDEQIYLGPLLMNKKSSITYYQKQIDHFNFLINEQGASINIFQKELTMLIKQIEYLKTL